MRTISLVVDSFGAVTPSEISVGRQGEHNVSTLIFKPDAKILSAVGYFRVALGDYLSERLYAKSQEISFTLPQCVLLNSTLLIQLEGYSVNDSGEVLRVFKSDILSAKVKHSIDPTQEVSDQVIAGAEGALAELSHYVDNGNALANSIGDMVEECAQMFKAAEGTLANKADKSTTLSGYGITNAFTKDEVNQRLNNKADKSTTLLGYGITNAYTKAEVNLIADGKADKCHTLEGYEIYDAYTKDETDAKLDNKADKSTSLAGYGITDAYTKEEGNKLAETLSSGLLVGNTSEQVHEESSYLLKKENIEIDGVTYPYVYYFSILNTIKPKKTYRLNLHNATYDLSIEELFYSRNLKIVCTNNILLTSFNSYGEWFDYTASGEYLSAKFSVPDMPDGTNVFFMFTSNSDICPPNSPASYNPISILLEVFTDYTKPYYKHEVYNKAEVDELTNPARVLIANGDTVYLENNKTYYAKEPINRLNVSYPNGDFIASLEFTVAKDNDGIISISLPQSKYIGGAPTLADGETWELNIKNGVVAGGLVE